MNALTQTRAETTHIDVIVVGAGISGIGSAVHLNEQCPDKTWLILEMKDSFGGMFPLDRFEEMLGELKAMGTRAIRLSGGGEPLFHRKIHDFLRAIKASGLPIENLTTNGVLLRSEVAELLVGTCEQVTFSLNTADETTYAAMMQTNERNFQRVIDNLRGLVAAKRRQGARNPRGTPGDGCQQNEPQEPESAIDQDDGRG